MEVIDGDASNRGVQSAEQENNQAKLRIHDEVSFVKTMTAAAACRDERLTFDEWIEVTIREKIFREKTRGTWVNKYVKEWMNGLFTTQGIHRIAPAKRHAER